MESFQTRFRGRRLARLRVAAGPATGRTLLWLLCVFVMALGGCQTTQPVDPRIPRAEASTRAGAWEAAASLWTEIYRASGSLDRRAGLESARAFMASGRPGVARARLLDLGQRWPDDAAILESLGAAHEEVGDAAAARLAYKRALALEPDLTLARTRLGVLGLRAGASAEAADSMAQLRASGSLGSVDAQSLFELGLSAAEEERSEEAFEFLSAALGRGALSVGQRLQAAEALVPDPRVIPWLTKIVREDPLHTRALTALGVTQAAAGLRGRALATLEEAVSSDPSDPAAVRAYAAALDEAGQASRASEVRALLPEGSSVL